MFFFLHVRVFCVLMSVFVHMFCVRFLYTHYTYLCIHTRVCAYRSKVEIKNTCISYFCVQSRETLHVHCIHIRVLVCKHDLRQAFVCVSTCLTLPHPCAIHVRFVYMKTKASKPSPSRD